MEFLDFELRISEGSGGAYSVAVVHSPMGEATATMRLPFDDQELRRRLQAVGNARGVDAQTRKVSDPQRALILPQEADAKPRDTIRNFGRELFEALLPSEVRSCYRSSRNTARAQGKGLRLRLRIDAPKLAALPWEYLYDEAEGDYICLTKQTPVIRYPELALPPNPLTIKPPLRILGMIASPTDLPKLDTELEKRQMAEAIQHLQDKGQVSLTWLEGSTWRDLDNAMCHGTWHIFHFIGHGDFDAKEQEGLIALANEQGKSDLFPAEQFGRLLAGHASMRLVVLNSCEGARASETDLFSSTGAVLTRRGIPAVVSMQDAITDRAALEFSRRFYEMLAEGLPVDAAVTHARIAINMTMRESFEWGTPVLHMRASDGHLFDINAAGAIFPEATETPRQKPSPPSVEAAQPPVQSSLPRPATDDTQRGLSILLRKVKQFWIEGVLDNSLSHSGLIDLGLETLPERVDSPLGSTRIDPHQPIATICDELGYSFLILGVPGAGKTTIMLTLVRELIAQAEKDPSHPIPVVTNLTSWTGSNQTLFDWMADELGTKYGIPKEIGRSWLQQSRLRLFLDGLDEVSADRRAACVQAINAFTQETSLVSVIVCCRFNEYIELPARLTLNGAIRLRTLSRDQIAAHLTRAGSRLQKLQSLLQRDSSIQALAETPFMLSMMIRTYQDLPLSELDSGQFATIEARKRQLMDAYVQRQFRFAITGASGG